MISCIYFLTLLNFITDSLAQNSLVPAVPNSDCPLIDDINHAVMLPYPLDCSKYFSCLKGMAYVQQCPNNLHWSTLTYRCDYPDKAKCATSVLPIATNTIHQAAASSLPVSLTSEIRYHLHPHDCSKYYKCQVLDCPTNYFWNARMQKCDFPHNARCSYFKNQNDFKNLNTLTTLTHNSLPLQANQENIFTLEYPNDCAKFYECQLMLCPATYHWNLHMQQCDLPQAASCSGQPEITEILETSTAAVPTAFTPPPTTTSTTVVAGTPQINVTGSAECLDCVRTCDGYLHHYLPHPYDCHKFIQCNGWSFIHTCPDNLFWNAKLNTCDRSCVAG